MKVLTINSTYDTGSTGKIIFDLSHDLTGKVDFYKCYQGGPASSIDRYRISSRPVAIFYYLLARLIGLKHSTGILPTLMLIHKIKKNKPDIVHVHCPSRNTVHLPLLINFLKNSKIPTIITNHAEFFYTGNCSHSIDCLKFQSGCGNCNYLFDPCRKYLFDRTAKEWKLMKNAFDNARNFTMVAVSPWVQSRIKISPITSHLKTLTIINGINTDLFSFASNQEIKIDDFFDQSDFILHVTSSFSDDINDLKGGVYILELAKRMPSQKFAVIGNFRISNPEIVPENIKLLGHIGDQLLLAEYYRRAKLTVLSSKRETFGMACAESLCCGTPVVGFKAGGTESIGLDGFCEFTDYGSSEALHQLAVKWLVKSFDRMQISELARKKYSSETMSQDYYSLYKQVLMSVENGPRHLPNG